MKTGKRVLAIFTALIMIAALLPLSVLAEGEASDGTVAAGMELSGNGDATGNAEISGSGENAGNEESSGSGDTSGNVEISGSGDAAGDPELTGEGSVIINSDDQGAEGDEQKTSGISKDGTPDTSADPSSDVSMPAFYRSMDVGQVTISVAANAGVFPEEAKLFVAAAPSSATEAAIEVERESGVNVAASYTFDIKVLDENGTELQPAKGQTVNVSFRACEIADPNLDVSVYHVSGGAADALDVQENGSTATAQTTGFSYYTVEFTYDKMQYVLPGVGSVALSDILAAVGLEGEPASVEVSDPALFSVSNESGMWVVTSRKAFSSNEWMRVTISGVPYEINVTDAPADPGGCIVFTSEESFKVSLGPEQNWDGTVYYSLDNSDWVEYTAGTMISSGDGNAVFFRGTKNTRFGRDNNNYSCFSLQPDGSNTVSCSGNIENLLDYDTVRKGGHPDMGTYAFVNLFLKCTSLAAAPVLPAEKLTEGCYANMFYGCTSLEKAPELKATELADYCCHYMFYDCTSLKKAPELKATELAKRCYFCMFANCKSLEKAPELNAAELADYCYAGMFLGCTGLKEAPDLNATTLGIYCYYAMFANCNSLEKAPELNATKLADYCYYAMFYGCSSLEKAPDLPAEELFPGCYNDMFTRSGVKISENKGVFGGVYYGTPYRIPTEGEGKTANNALDRMFSDTAGPFTGTPDINKTYYLPGAPEGCIVFTSEEPFKVSLGPTRNWDGTVYYSLDNSDWVEYTAGTKISSGEGRAVFFRGTKNKAFSKSESRCSSFTLYPIGDNTISCSGNIENLLDFDTVTKGGHPEMNEFTFTRLFCECSALTSAPALPAETLRKSCYLEMFAFCGSLEKAPDLPAEKLAEECYGTMFWACYSLKKAPKLNATELADYCCAGMFMNCESLEKAPDLNAPTLGIGCYYLMFANCKSLTVPPALPAKEMEEECYYRMFANTGVKISDKAGTFDGVTYATPYRIPREGEGKDAKYALQDMFSTTSGPFSGTPEINRFYYLPGGTLIDVPEGKTFVYTGEEQTGVEAGEGYTLTNDKATEAGPYTAVATLQDGYLWSDGDPGAKNVSWTITPTEEAFTVSLDGSEYTYDGTAKAIRNVPSSTAKTGTTTYEYSFDKNGTYTKDLSSLTKTDAGIYTVYVKGTNPNYKNPAETTAMLTITPTEEAFTVSLEDSEYTYDGTDKAITNSPSSTAKTGTTAYEYSFDKNGTYTKDLSSLTKTDVGIYTVYVKATNPNYKNPAETTAVLTVAPAKATITAADASKTEGEADPAFTGTVEGLVNEGDLGEISYKRTNTEETPGVYKGVITAEYTENTNYDVTVKNGDFTIEEKISYKAVSGDGQTYTKGSDKTLAFTFKRSEEDETAFGHFKGIEIDGEAVPEKDASGKANWTAKSGSVIIELQSSYLDTLSVGEHKLAVKFDDAAAADAGFTVKAKNVTPTPTPTTKPTASPTTTPSKNNNSPKTGDENQPFLLFVALLASALLLGSIAYDRRKRN